MREELERLAAALYRPEPGGPAGGDPLDVSDLLAQTWVVLPAGGFGFRMRGVSEDAGAVTQKSLLPLPNGETLISRVVRQYAEAGFRRFVALVNHAGSAVEAYLDGGRAWDVEVRTSHDPEATGSGRTGALLHALSTGVLPAESPLIVHNADCQVYGYRGSFPIDLLRAHSRAALGAETAATLAAVEGSPYPYSGMSIRSGRVTDVEMYPFIPVPTHTGITFLAPAALQTIQENAATSRKNFESDLFPRWAAEGKLAAMVISHRHWTAVDDRKSYRQFCQAIEEGG